MKNIELEKLKGVAINFLFLHFNSLVKQSFCIKKTF